MILFMIVRNSYTFKGANLDEKLILKGLNPNNPTCYVRKQATTTIK